MKPELKTWQQKAGLAVVIASIILGINGAVYFLAAQNFTITEWLFFNICAPSTLVFITGYFLNKKILMTSAIPFLFFFGTGGMFVFSWQGTSIIAQINHLLMTAMIVYAIYFSIKDKKAKQGILGFAIGLIIFIIILPYQQAFIKNNPELLKKVGDQQFEEFILKQNQ